MRKFLISMLNTAKDFVMIHAPTQGDGDGTDVCGEAQGDGEHVCTLPAGHEGYHADTKRGYHGPARLCADHAKAPTGGPKSACPLCHPAVPEQPIDYEELSRTGQTRIKGFRHNLYGNGTDA